jgi:KDO2-lipid IV(A) lauroyltransferase
MTRILLAIINAVSWFLAALGPKRSIAIGQAFGSFVFYVLPIRRKLVLENLRGAFPEKTESERRQIALKCYRQLGRVVFETLFMPKLKPEAIAKMSRWHNAEIIEQSFAQNKGLIFCMSHGGNWELIGHEGARRGYKFWAITKVLKGAFNEAIMASRKKNFGELPPSGSFHKGLELLSQKLALALIIDQHRAGNKAVIVDFLGRPAATSPSPALFAIRSGAPVIAGWMSVGEDGVYDLWFRGPFPVPEGLPLEEQIQRHTQMIADDLSQFIREHPGDWYWVHRRWKVDEAKKPELKAAEQAA